MQPRCRQVPPSLSFSIRTTDRPSCAARNAVAYPPLPPPRMTTSLPLDMGGLALQLSVWVGALWAPRGHLVTRRTQRRREGANGARVAHHNRTPRGSVETAQLA